jgi:nicotinamide-nucleotide amidase
MTTDDPIEARLADLLRERDRTIAVAETFTGGLVSDIITNMPGASRYFLGGIVTYSDRSKVKSLGVRESTLRVNGAVSEQTASEMALGVREHFGSDYGIAITGLACPGGASFGKPIGLVFFSFTDGKTTMVDRMEFSGDRLNIKRAAASQILRMTVDCIIED